MRIGPVGAAIGAGFGEVQASDIAARIVVEYCLSPSAKIRMRPIIAIDNEHFIDVLED